MASLRRQLGRLSKRKDTIRKSRRDLRVVALVGYTNAGKSTLMQQMTGADVYIEDQLFATLDTTTRRILNGGNGTDGAKEGNSENNGRGGDEILLVDTVGFIRKLPHHLVNSFKATLEDIAQADLYLHIVDASHPAYEEHMEVTDNTVRSIENAEAGTMYVFNKIDLLSEEELAGLEARYPDGVFVSARDDTGLDALWGGVDRFFYGNNLKVEVKVPAGDGRTIARVRNILHNAVGTFEDDMCVLNGTVETGQMGRLERVTGAEIRYIL
jgi:GTP-binding protein HflX